MNVLSKLRAVFRLSLWVPWGCVWLMPSQARPWGRARKPLRGGGH